MRLISFLRLRASLAASLTLTVCIIVLVTTLAVSLAGYWTGRASVERQIRERLAASSSQAMTATDSYLNARVQEMREMTHSQLQVTSITPVDRSRILADYAGAFGSQRYADISIVSLAGLVIASSGAPQIDRSSAAVHEWTTATLPGITDAMRFPDRSQDLFVVYAPMLDENGKHTGTLIARMLPTELVDIVRNVPVDADTALYVTHHGAELGENRGANAPLFAQASSSVLTANALEVPGAIDLGFGITGVTQPRAEFAPMRDLTIRSAIVGIVVLALALLAAAWSARRISRPLDAVASAAHALAAGDLAANVDAERLDLRELRDLGTSFNMMAQTLRGLIGGIGSASSAISTTVRQSLSTAETLRAGTEQQTHASRRITAALQELSTNARAIETNCVELESSSRKGSDQLGRLVAEVDSTSVALMQLTESIDRSNEAGRTLARQAMAVSDRARDVGKRAEAAQASADRGGAAVRGLIADIQHVGARLVQTVERLEHLASATATAITAQVEVISDMAERSKLLALNAGIEAARAGVSGRGFSVIATELHRLAGGSKDAGDAVNRLVGTVVVETKELVVNAQAASDLARGAISRASETGTTIDQLITEIAENTRGAREIGAIAENQAARTVEIETATGEMRAMAHQTATSANAVGELSRSVRGAVDFATRVAEGVTHATREQALSLGIIGQSAGDIERNNGLVADAAHVSFETNETLQREIAALAERVDSFVVDASAVDQSILDTPARAAVNRSLAVA